MQKFACCLVMLSAACGPTWGHDDEYVGDPSENAIAAFEAVHGPISEKCAQRALDMEVDFVPRATIERECNAPSAIGCMYRYDAVRSSAYVAEGYGAAVIAHETAHVLFRCERPHDIDGSHRHTDPVWQDWRVR